MKMQARDEVFVLVDESDSYLDDVGLILGDLKRWARLGEERASGGMSITLWECTKIELKIELQTRSASFDSSKAIRPR